MPKLKIFDIGIKDEFKQALDNSLDVSEPNELNFELTNNLLLTNNEKIIITDKSNLSQVVLENIAHDGIRSGYKTVFGNYEDNVLIDNNPLKEAEKDINAYITEQPPTEPFKSEHFDKEDYLKKAKHGGYLRRSKSLFNFLNEQTVDEPVTNLKIAKYIHDLEVDSNKSLDDNSNRFNVDVLNGNIIKISESVTTSGNTTYVVPEITAATSATTFTIPGVVSKPLKRNKSDKPTAVSLKDQAKKKARQKLAAASKRKNR